ncbi:MAG TPA: zinc metallopeptidase [Feifaniaceae bacterium]|nr:zinc metallopeptidase [Feifaniaceae bacterium]
MYYPAFGYDSTLWLIIGAMILSMIAQGAVRRTFQKYDRVTASANMPAADIARELLRQQGSPVQVASVGGELTDHFNPKTNIVGLSQTVYHERSVAAIAVAAHEIGHVMQYEQGYLPIRVRNAILPVASFGSQAAPWIVIAGLLFSNYNLAMAGVILFGAMLLFQVVTLPVEFNASSRAVEMLSSGGYLSYDEVPQAKKVLRAAAFTYVVAALASLANFLRLLGIANRSRRSR